MLTGGRLEPERRRLVPSDGSNHRLRRVPLYQQRCDAAFGAQDAGRARASPPVATSPRPCAPLRQSALGPQQLSGSTLSRLAASSPRRIAHRILVAEPRGSRDRAIDDARSKRRADFGMLRSALPAASMALARMARLDRLAWVWRLSPADRAAPISTAFCPFIRPPVLHGANRRQLPAGFSARLRGGDKLVSSAAWRSAALHSPSYR